MRIRSKVTAAALLATAVLAGTAGPAAAHSDTWDIYFNHITGRIIVGTMSISNLHRTVQICDKKANGHGVYVEFWVDKPDGSEYYKTLSDTNGSADGCGDWTATGGGVISRLKGNERDTGYTTGWVTA